MIVGVIIMELVETEEQIVENVLKFNSYSRSKNQREVDFYSDKLRHGKKFVCFRRNGEMLFTPSRFAGYIHNTITKHLAFPYKDGKITTPRIDFLLGPNDENNSKLEKLYLNNCQARKLVPDNKRRGYWQIDNAHTAIKPSPPMSGEADFPDEVPSTNSYIEGGVKSVLVNIYERNPKARKACIKHYGSNCQVCNFQFDLAYGSTGEGFIHVHHLKPEMLRKSNYVVDPIKDLIPVCPNCHSMIHRSDPPFEPSALKELLRIKFSYKRKR